MAGSGTAWRAMSRGVLVARAWLGMLQRLSAFRFAGLVQLNGVGMVFAGESAKPLRGCQTSERGS